MPLLGHHRIGACFRQHMPAAVQWCVAGTGDAFGYLLPEPRRHQLIVRACNDERRFRDRWRQGAAIESEDGTEPARDLVCILLLGVCDLLRKPGGMGAAIVWWEQQAGIEVGIVLRPKRPGGGDPQVLHACQVPVAVGPGRCQDVSVVNALRKGGRESHADAAPGRMAEQARLPDPQRIQQPGHFLGAVRHGDRAGVTRRLALSQFRADRSG